MIIGLAVPFIIYGFFLTLPIEGGDAIEDATKYALMFSILIALLSYFLTKNIYLSLGILLLAIGIDMVI